MGMVEVNAQVARGMFPYPKLADESGKKMQGFR